MQPSFGIRKLGFKRWFERRLIESHVYLVTCFFCLILVLAAFEDLSARAGYERAVMLALIVGGGALGILSWDRYRLILFRALQLSARSTCGRCGAYARFNVLDSARAESHDTDEVQEGSWLKVKCRNCGHEWIME